MRTSKINEVVLEEGDRLVVVVHGAEVSFHYDAGRIVVTFDGGKKVKIMIDPTEAVSVGSISFNELIQAKAWLGPEVTDGIFQEGDGIELS